jgi:hypothetical protein
MEAEPGRLEQPSVEGLAIPYSVSCVVSVPAAGLPRHRLRSAWRLALSESNAGCSNWSSRGTEGTEPAWGRAPLSAYGEGAICSASSGARMSRPAVTALPPSMWNLPWDVPPRIYDFPAASVRELVL